MKRYIWDRNQKRACLTKNGRVCEYAGGPRLVKNRVRAKNRVRFDVCSLPLHFMTSKIHHHDRNGHITRNFFHCTALISPIAKVMGLQSWERKGPFYFLTKNITLGIEKVFSMTAMVILLISLISFIIGNIKLL